MNSRYRQRVILTHIRILKRLRKIGQYSEVHKGALAWYGKLTWESAHA